MKPLNGMLSKFDFLLKYAKADQMIDLEEHVDINYW